MFSVATLPGYTPLSAASEGTSSPQRRHQGAAVGGKQPPASKGAAAAASSSSPCQGEGAAWVTTDDQVAEYFAQHGPSAPQQFFYAVKVEEGSTARAFDLVVVPQERVRNLTQYYILSARQVARIDRRHGEHTEAVSLAEWVAHKRNFHHMRQLTFFGCFSLAKCFRRWRRAARSCVIARRRRQLQQSLFLGWRPFQKPLLDAASLLEQLRAVRAAKVQPSRLCTAADFAEQQGAWRSRRAQPELEAAAAQLVRVAEGVCTEVETTAQRMLDTTRPSELGDRIGVDLFAATSKAKARSMQDIRQDKMSKAGAYWQALTQRDSLPRFLRMLDLRLASTLADMAAGSTTDAAGALRVAFRGSLPTGAASSAALAGEDSAQGEEADEEEPDNSHSGGASSASPAFICNLVFTPDGGVGFSPSEAEWAAALEGEAVSSGLRLASSVPALLTLPAFERYHAQLQAAAAAADAASEQQQQQPAAGEAKTMPAVAEVPARPVQLVQQDRVFAGAAAEMKGMLQGSFAAARRLAQRYQHLHAIQAFEHEWDFEAFASEQRSAGLDLGAMEAVLMQLQQWQGQLESMQLTGTAGLLHLDATELQASLRPIVTSAQERVGSLLLQLASDKCRQHLNELAMWLEVAVARPAELDGFLSWSAEVAHMQQEQGRLLGGVAAADAALELVVTFAGKLPTAEAVKRDDLLEGRDKLPLELTAAAAWRAEHLVLHAAAVAEQARALVEEAIILESELSVGIYVDASAASSEVLADLDVQQSRLAQLAAQAEELAGVQEELGEAADSFAEVKEAAAALQRRAGLWSAVAEAELLQASLVGHEGQAAGQADGDLHDMQAGGPADSEVSAASAPAGSMPPSDTSAQLAALQARLVELRGGSGPPDAVWLRANGALLACKEALAG